jgi:general secretion pathway protein J
MPCKLHMSRSSSSGFTLIELLVAITILAIVAVLGWRGLDGIVRARMVLNEEMAQTRGIQLAFAQLENDCAHLVDPALLTGNDVLTAAGNKLMLIRSVLEENQPVRYQVVVYSVADGQLGRRELSSTREIGQIQRDWIAAAGDTDNAPVIQLKNNVTSFSIRTWRQSESAWRNGGEEIQSSSQTAAQVANPAGSVVMLSQSRERMSGLEVSLQVEGKSSPMVKIFLLGAN